MTSRTAIIMVAAHVCISLAGALIHGKLHSPANSLYFWWASPVSLFSLTVIPVLYWRPSTVAWGFMLNAGTILIGTVGMAYYAVHKVEIPLTLQNILFQTPLPWILVLWIKVPVSLIILRIMLPLRISPPQRQCVEASD